jgi:hypothetical protein
MDFCHSHDYIRKRGCVSEFPYYYYYYYYYYVYISRQYKCYIVVTCCTMLPKCDSLEIAREILVL